MKKSLNCMLLLSMGCAYAAADKQSGPVTIIAQKPAAALNTMIHTGLGRLPEDARKSDMGLIYVAIDESPYGINSLWEDPAVVAQAQEYNGFITANPVVQQLTAAVTTLVQNNASPLKCAAALGALGIKYSLMQAKITKKAIPGIVFPIVGTVDNTIESNVHLQLMPEQQMLYKAAQLSMALNVATQYGLVPTVADDVWHQEQAVPSASTSSSPGQRRAVDKQYHGCELI